jgi:hypothetical protein
MLYTRLSWGTVALHLVQAIVVCALTVWLDSSTTERNKGVFPLYKNVQVWSTNSSGNAESPVVSGVTVHTIIERAGTLDVRWVIVAFFSLSAAFPAALLWFDLNPSFRFVEYSISASAMLMAIAVESGIQDVYTLQTMFVLTFATMILGLLTEFMPPPLSWIAHGTAWITFLSAYSPIFDAFLQSNHHSNGASAPGFVYVIVFLEFALFAFFGVVQVYALFFAKDSIMAQPHEQQELLSQASSHNNNNKPDMNNEENDEISDAMRIQLAYVFLSLVAKTILAWLILAPILMA